MTPERVTRLHQPPPGSLPGHPGRGRDAVTKVAPPRTGHGPLGHRMLRLTRSINPSQRGHRQGREGLGAYFSLFLAIPTSWFFFCSFYLQKGHKFAGTERRVLPSCNFVSLLPALRGAITISLPPSPGIADKHAPRKYNLFCHS